MIFRDTLNSAFAQLTGLSFCKSSDAEPTVFFESRDEMLHAEVEGVLRESGGDWRGKKECCPEAIEGAAGGSR